MKAKDKRRIFCKERITIYKVNYDENDVVLVGMRSGKSYLMACISIAYFLRSIVKETKECQ